ncbi:flagellar protein FlaG [Desulfosporosinus acidiphilus SJ4]|uniref:Flagellar protein FlaG n=1 Tax=Desulfosporosinus acidiphilus (strain DSM 22704 / JCM 16185 / SJ4) TaxID=646529 RepID=I4DAA7_DESAJ|nr:flagellar protein FlaG [Desulfosporosinus acidiphilus]AFM42731.1 flagellar protein FlaG [Desulfosporosinus acidiphilus SJ4]
MVNPIQPNNEVIVAPVEVFPGQKSDNTQEVLVPIVDRKQEVPSAREEIPRESIEKTAEKLNRMMGIIDKNMKFVIDEKTHKVSVKVVNSKTGEILGEVPPESIMDLLGSFTNLAGLLLNQYT